LKEPATLNAHSDSWQAMIHRARIAPSRRGPAAHRGLDDIVSSPCAKGVVNGVNHHFACNKATCPCECHKSGR